MKNAYKVKIDDLISSVDGRLKLIEAMMSGQKRADPTEASQYLRESRNGLEKIKEFISIS